MSELKVDKVSPRTGNYVALNTVGSKNIVINGDMSIAQRSTSVASITGAGYYTLDRYYLYASSLGTWTMSQDTDVPTGQGFAKSLKLDCTAADAAPGAGDALALQTKFEGQNLQYLKKGTSNAVSLTASFWVKSTKTGTFIVELYDTDNSRSISKSYTIDSASTWEKKTITFAGDTTGTFTNDNGNSLEFNFWLGAGTTFTSGTLQTTWGTRTNANIAVGQVNLADNTANEWYITGVQLEAGTTASDFEFLPVDVNLQRCERYCQILDSEGGTDKAVFSGVAYLNNTIIGSYTFSKMRAAPTITITDPTFVDVVLGSLAQNANNTLSLSDITSKSCQPVVINSGTPFTVGHGAVIRFDGASVVFSAEL